MTNAGKNYFFIPRKVPLLENDVMRAVNYFIEIP
jgi:hypothetical protein